MNLQYPIQFFRRQWLPLSAVVLGLVLGRSLRHAPPERRDQALAGVTVPNEGGVLAHEGLASDDDSAVEAEVARLLGGRTAEKGERTAQQTMDAIKASFDEKSDLRRFLAIYEAVSELGKDDISEALTRAKKEENPIAVRALERRWAEIDPVGAMKAWSEGKAQPLSDAFFAAWTKSNAAGALQWFSTLEDGELKKQARGLLLDRIAKSDPERALDFANQLPAGEDQARLVARALAALGSKDQAAAMAAVQRLPEGEARRVGMDSVVSQLAATNIEAAQKMISELPANTVSSAGAAVAAALVKQSPDKALEWAASLPEGQSKEAVYGGIAREWANRDVAAAAAWLDSLSKGTTRDAAVASFANRTAPRDPEGATIWASTLPPGQQRSSVLTQTLGMWQRVNPAAASEWLAGAPGLSADEKAALSQAASQRFDGSRFQQGRRQRAGN